jgi:cytochrome c oxidase assembly protein subunit 15
LKGGRAAPLVPGEVRRLGLVLASACLGLVVSGTFVTAAGPHPGGSDVRRLGELDTALAVHVRATAVFGCALLFVLGYLAARRERSPRLFRASLGLVGLVVLQMAVGETQYRAHLPWWLVLVHVALAAAVWAATVAVVTVFFRPPASFAEHRA